MRLSFPFQLLVYVVSICDMVKPTGIFLAYVIVPGRMHKRFSH